MCGRRGNKLKTDRKTTTSRKEQAACATLACMQSVQSTIFSCCIPDIIGLSSASGQTD